MGTVTTAAQAEHAADAGAKFLVCPGLCPGVVEVAAVRGIPCYPGAWTPSEVMTAWDSGATAVKLFPAASGGPAHLRRIRDPLPDVPLIPTGGVGLAEVREYLVSGAIAVGLGSPLIGDALEGGDLGALRARVQLVHAEVAAARETR
jgi:2-dehydro-3-deoxyphosphogluconate aldolase / (4S)-4-hydroxy-2-oxoglutarate aldolase